MRYTFKVGDRVLVKGGYSVPSQIYLGMQATIARVVFNEHDGSVHHYRLDIERPSDGGVWPEEVELVSPAASPDPAQDTLERLVATANAGLRAIERLHKDFNERVICKHPSSSYASVRVWYEPEQPTIRIKPAPAFEPFTVGKGWRVELVEGAYRDEYVKVGCQTFSITWLRTSLAGLIEQECSQSDGTTPLVATRSGIRWGAHSIPWPDADRLLEALKKVKEAA